MTDEASTMYEWAGAAPHWVLIRRGVRCAEVWARPDGKGFKFCVALEHADLRGEKRNPHDARQECERLLAIADAELQRIGAADAIHAQGG